jgi:hypothetical protein
VKRSTQAARLSRSGSLAKAQKFRFYAAIHLDPLRLTLKIHGPSLNFGILRLALERFPHPATFPFFPFFP